jgi:hypothetical protein
MRRVLATLALRGASLCDVVAAAPVASPTAEASTPNPCGLLAKTQMSTAMGARITAATPQIEASGSTCTYSVNAKTTADGYGSVFIASTTVASSEAKTHHTTDISTVSGFTKYYLDPRGSQGPAFDQRVSGLGKVAGFNAQDSEIDVLPAREVLSISIDKLENGAAVPVSQAVPVSLARLALKKI